VLDEENRGRKIVMKLLMAFLEEKGKTTHQQFSIFLRKQAQPRKWIQL
jgi:hypothetical protein